MDKEEIVVIFWLIVIIAFLLYCYIFVSVSPKDRKKESFEELRYEESKEEKFWKYYGEREQGKLTDIVPEFEERIAKMNKLV